VMATLEPYPEVRESGVPWLGEVPEHWEVRRLRTITEIRVSNVDKHIKEGETPVRLCNYVDVYKNDRITERMDFMRATATSEEIAQSRLSWGDVLITKDSETWDDIAVPALVTEPASDLISGYHLALLRPLTGLVSGEYLFRALQSRAVACQFHVEAKGVTRYGLSHQAIGSVRLPLPHIPEQTAIVRYLDYIDRRVRRYVRAKQKLIDLLEEEKQAIIHRAVTRGVDPDVRLKPSGVEWLGDVPEHWEVRRLKFLAQIKTGGRDTVDRRDDGDYPFFVRSQTVERIDSYSFDGEAVLTAGDGAGVAKVFHYFVGKFDYHQRVYKFSNFRKIRGKFFFHYFSSTLRHAAFRETAKSTVDSLRLPMLQNFRVPVPPSDEQLQIVEAIERETLTLERSLTKVRRKIQLVREYNNRLIADVVTGKLDVRVAAANLPDEPDDTGPLDEIDRLMDERDASSDELGRMPGETEA
jgi:type I restriction enzyme S subunit